MPVYGNSMFFMYNFPQIPIEKYGSTVQRSCVLNLETSYVSSYAFYCLFSSSAKTKFLIVRISKTTRRRLASAIEKLDIRICLGLLCQKFPLLFPGI